MSLAGFCPFFHLESSDGVSEWSLPISTLSYTRAVSCSPSAFYAVAHSLSKCWHAFCYTRGWQTNDISHAAFTKARPNGAKIMAPRWRHVLRKKFPVRKSETKLVRIALPRFSILTAADLSLKDDFEQLFNFQGPVISECTIISVNPCHFQLRPHKVNSLLFVF